MLNVNLLANPRELKGLAVQFPYDRIAVDQIRMVLGLSWDKFAKVWTSLGPEVLLDMERFAIQPSWVSGEAKIIAEEFRQQLWNVMDARVEDYHDELYGYQKQGSKILASMPFSILGDDPGIGKSKQALDAAVILNAQKVLVICPKTLTYNWLAEVDKWYPEISAGVVPDITTERKHHSSDISRKNFWKNPPHIVITNYEKLRMSDWPMEIEWDVVICDEITKCKTATTQTYKAVKKVINLAKCTWGLTGTPLEIRLEELYNILSLLRPAILGNYMRFRDHHLVTDWAGSVVGIKNINLLRERIAPFILRRTKSEVLSMLPPKTYQNIFVKLSLQEDSAYKAFTAEFNNWLSERGISGKGDPLVQMLRMRQFCCTPAIFTDELGKGSKFETLKEIVDEWPGQIVIFCFFEEAVSLYQQWLGCHSDAIISGKVKSEDRLPRIDAFNRGELGKILMSTDAGGMGLNITGADLIIHLDQLFNPQRMKQREDRAHRIGQNKPVTVMNMLCIDTVDYGMLQLNKERDELFKSVVDGAEEAILRKLDAPRLKRLVEGKL